MENIYDLLVYGVGSVFDWMTSIEYLGINVLQVCFFGFFLKLIWDLILSPVIGHRSGGSLSVSASDMVRGSRAKKTEPKNDYATIHRNNDFVRK